MFINLLLLSLGVALFSQRAYAYLDPGTGSYIFQILIASSMGAIYLIKTFWRQISSFFSKLFKKNKK